MNSYYHIKQKIPKRYKEGSIKGKFLFQDLMGLQFSDQKVITKIKTSKQNYKNK